MTKNILMETLSKEFIPLSYDIFDSEKRHYRILKWTFSHVQPMNLPISWTQS